jgi:hypothetical protein
MDKGKLFFVTDGTSFIGPYEIGDPAVVRGKLTLLDANPGADVFAVSGNTRDEARRAWERAAAMVAARRAPGVDKIDPDDRS